MDTRFDRSNPLLTVTARTRRQLQVGRLGAVMTDKGDGGWRRNGFSFAATRGSPSVFETHRV